MKSKYPPCIFCGLRRRPSKEDVLARWIAREWPSPGKFFVEGGQTGQPPDEKWGAVGTLGIIVKKPCEACNNGWMSDLEDEAKRVLTPLLWGRDAYITTGDKLVLSRWMVKTAIMYEYFRRHSPRFFGPSHRTALFESGGIPPTTQISIGRYAGKQAAYLFDSKMTFTWKQDGEVLSGPAYAVTFSIGQAVLQVLSFRPPADLRSRLISLKLPVSWRSALVNIWPIDGNSKWPPEAVLTDDSLARFANRWTEMQE